MPECAEQLGWHNRVNFDFGTEELRNVKPDAVSFWDFLGSRRIEGM